MQKKAAKATVASIVVATAAPWMVFLQNEAVVNVVHKKRKRQAPSSSCVKKNKGSVANTISTTTPNPV
jgi:hypothetical protein